MVQYLYILLFIPIPEKWKWSLLKWQDLYFVDKWTKMAFTFWFSWLSWKVRKDFLSTVCSMENIKIKYQMISLKHCLHGIFILVHSWQIFQSLSIGFILWVEKEDSQVLRAWSKKLFMYKLGNLLKPCRPMCSFLQHQQSNLPQTILRKYENPDARWWITVECLWLCLLFSWCGHNTLSHPSPAQWSS